MFVLLIVRPEVDLISLQLDFVFLVELRSCVSGMLSRRAGPFFLAVPCCGVMWQDVRDRTHTEGGSSTSRTAGF